METAVATTSSGSTTTTIKTRGQRGAQDIAPGGGEPAQPALEIALAYHERGWSVIDLHAGSKAPVRQGWQKEHLDPDAIRARFNGQPQNIGVLLGAPSQGLIDVDLDHPLAVRLAPAFLPETGALFGRQSKPGGHRLYRCDAPYKSETFKDPRTGAMLAEIRASGQTMFPGSVHPSGEAVRWDASGEPAKVEGTDLRKAVAHLCAAAALADHWPERGGRHQAALALAGGLLRAEWELETAETFVARVARAAGDEEIDDRLRAIADTKKKLDAGEPCTGWPALAETLGEPLVHAVKGWLGIRDGGARPNLTDLGNAQRLVARHGADLRYCELWRRWLVWDGRRWQKDETGEIYRRAKETTRAIYVEASREADEDQRKRIAKWAFNSEAERRIEAMVKLARSEPGIAITPEDLDRQPWLLNVQDGTLDLQRGELRPHRREDLLTKLAPVHYDPKAECPLWLAFLNRIMGGNARLIGYLQRYVGYTLTGDGCEKVLLVGHGGGDNGKTTFVETVLALLGEDYAMTTPEATIAATRSDAIPNDVARLRGARFVVVSETAQDLRLNEGRIKAMTGRNRIAARFMHAEWFEFVPEFKLFIETNHRPQVQGTDNAIWNRLKLVPFAVAIPKVEQDKELPAKLREELPGILRWAVEGCLTWQREGLGEPEEIQAATADYRGDMDTLGDFIAAHCTLGEHERAKSTDLYAAYRGWSERVRGERPMSQVAFSTALIDRGFQRTKSRGVMTYRGVGLSNPTLADVPPTPANPFDPPGGRQG